MSLNNCWVLGLTQDLEEVIITDEIEAGELGSLLLKEAVEGLLALVKLTQNGFKCVLNTRNVTKTDNFWIVTDTKSDVSELFIDTHESTLLLWECTSHEDGLKVNPLALNNIQLGEVVIDTTDLFFYLFNLISESCEVSRFLKRKDKTLMITDLRDDFLPLFNQWCRSSIRLIVGQDELSVLAPDPQLIDSLPNGDFTLCLVTQVLDLF